MKIDLGLQSHARLHGDDLRQLVGQGALAEESGFDGVLMGDHVVFGARIDAPALRARIALGRTADDPGRDRCADEPNHAHDRNPGLAAPPGRTAREDRGRSLPVDRIEPLARAGVTELTTWSTSLAQDTEHLPDRIEELGRLLRCR